MPLPVQVQRSAFWQAFAFFLLLASAYPATMLATMPSAFVWTYLRHDVTWSIYCLMLIPIGFGLMFSVFDLDTLHQASTSLKISFGVVFSLGLASIFLAVLDDARGIPTPERIGASPAKGMVYRDRAIAIDVCIRLGMACVEYRKFVEAVPDCRATKWLFIVEAGSSPEIALPAQAADKADSLLKKHAYICGLLKEAGGEIGELPRSAMVDVANILNFVLIGFVWTFIWVSHVYFFYARQTIGSRAMNVLLGCFVILITWFPLRLYADWYQWYGDLSHLRYYHAYLLLAVFALELLILYTIWVVTESTGISMHVIVPAVWSVAGAVAGLAAHLKPEWVDMVLSEIARLPGPFFMIGICGALLMIGSYTRALLYQT